MDDLDKELKLQIYQYDTLFDHTRDDLAHINKRFSHKFECFIINKEFYR